MQDRPATATAPQPRPDVVSLDSSLWATFANARGEGAFLTAWLALLVSRLGGVRLAAVLQADHGAGAFVPRAVVPDPRHDLSSLQGVAERSLASARPATETDPTAEDGAGLSRLAYPVRRAGEPVAVVVVLDLAGVDPRALQAALRELHWSAGWLAARLWEAKAGDEAGRVARAGIALDILAAMAEHRRPEAAAMAVANELQSVLAADQVAIGMVTGARTAPRIRLLSLSHTAWFRKRSAFAEALEAAMEEAFDQSGTVALPPLDSTARAIAVAHEDLRLGRPVRHVLTVALPDEAGTVGALSVLRRGDVPFTEDDRMVAEAVAALVGPVLELKRRTRRWVGGRIIDGTAHVLGVLLGPRRLSWKLLALALIALAVAAATVRAPFRVQAEAALQGTVQRAAVAPFAGYVDAAPLRAGDVVAAGDLLARLEDTDLRLEALRWRSEVDRLTAQSREALARADRTQIALLEAQIAQARAQMALTEGKLARTRILAPIDGVIVSGDLSQRLGAPVQPGEVLFEVAPVGDFRVELWLDERDLRHVAEGLPGRLLLAGQPSDGLAITLTRITPLAEPREGINSFRLEAALDAVQPGLRPGMEGVAKIDAGEALLSWIWTRRLIDWVRHTAWTWQP
ncbi:diguanylate cyclase [Rhodobaculum claviforme]|uniref:Diguanylate cyclase n=1 Tax=Rhodobaculum claviforme TaxID=1549854 RepID=A0A934WK11_9RHOB|nr:diguanylate cyclase [Rhodobaculum claviforme]